MKTPSHVHRDAGEPSLEESSLNLVAGEPHRSTPTENAPPSYARLGWEP
jgi:hypothetical protein